MTNEQFELAREISLQINKLEQLKKILSSADTRIGYQKRIFSKDSYTEKYI